MASCIASTKTTNKKYLCSRGVPHGFESRTPSWDSRIRIFASSATLNNFGYFRILHLKIFQLPWTLIWNPKLPGISRKDSKDSESYTLFNFVMDPSSVVIWLICIQGICVNLAKMTGLKWWLALGLKMVSRVVRSFFSTPYATLYRYCTHVFVCFRS